MGSIWGAGKKQEPPVDPSTVPGHPDYVPPPKPASPPVVDHGLLGDGATTAPKTVPSGEMSPGAQAAERDWMRRQAEAKAKAAIKPPKQ